MLTLPFEIFAQLCFNENKANVEIVTLPRKKILDLKSSSEQIFFRKLSLGAPVSTSASFSLKQS